MAQKGKSKISWITQRRNISSKPNYRQQEDHQVQTAENTVNGTAKIPSFNDPNNYYHSDDESLWASLTKTDSFGSTPVVQSDEWHPPEIGGEDKSYLRFRGSQCRSSFQSVLDPSVPVQAPY